MVNFTRDDVYYLFSDALGVGGPRKYARLRDAVRRDAEKTGNIENYVRFVAYTGVSIVLYLEARNIVFTEHGLLSGVLKTKEDFQNAFNVLQRLMLSEWTADKALDDDALKEIMENDHKQASGNC